MSMTEYRPRKGFAMKTTKYAIVLIIISMIIPYLTVAEVKSEEKKADQVRSAVSGSNRFALELYCELSKQQGNLFYSPYSISTALAMTYAGAKGKTACQMAEVMHYPNQPTCNEVFGQIIKNLNERNKESYRLVVSNALWGQKDYQFLPEFLNTIEDNYNGGFNSVDFAGETEKSRLIINKWVEKKTEEKIKDLIQKGILNTDTRLVLTNAIYFKGNWNKQFDKKATKMSKFTLHNGTKIQTDMMNIKKKFNYAQTETVDILELPYIDKELSMIILLPKDINGISSMERSLTTENLDKWLGKLTRTKVIVSIPKFKFVWDFGLSGTLQKMGMTDAFSRNADFSLMTGNKDLFISNVIHKAFIEVNEEGTEAAAATAVTMALTSISPGSIPVFRANHPFIFIIRDNITGSILFLGRIADPRE